MVGMYSHSEGDPETPRSDSPVIFVITDTRDRVHQYPHEAHLQQDWSSSNKGEQRPVGSPILTSVFTMF